MVLASALTLVILLDAEERSGPHRHKGDTQSRKASETSNPTSPQHLTRQHAPRKFPPRRESETVLRARWQRIP